VNDITEPTILVQGTRLREDIKTAILSGLAYHKPSASGGESWRQDSPEHLAEHLALHIAAGIAPAIDRHTRRVVGDTLQELQKPDDRYMRPADLAEEQREFWVPDVKSLARAMERLAPYTDHRVRAIIPMVMPGKAYNVWTAQQEVITVRPAVFLGIAAVAPLSGLPVISEAIGQALTAARVALDAEPGTVGWAMVTRDGHATICEMAS
jgi:hypothetical protein